MHHSKRWWFPLNLSNFSVSFIMICSFTIHVYNHLCTSFSPLDGKCVPTVLVCLLFCGSFYRPCGTWFEYLRTWSCPLLPLVVAVGEHLKILRFMRFWRKFPAGSVIDRQLLYLHLSPIFLKKFWSLLFFHGASIQQWVKCKQTIHGRTL